MKDILPGYYRPNDEEFTVMWSTGLFILDANVLLNLYRYSLSTSQELIDILTQIGDRLWVPYQAALEYQRNRLRVIAQQAKAYDDLQDIIDKSQKQFEEKLRSLTRHPSIDTNYLDKRAKKRFQAIENDLKTSKRGHPDLLRDDPIREKLTSLLNGKVGKPYTRKELDAIYRSAKERYQSKIPPVSWTRIRAARTSMVILCSGPR